MIIGIGELLWDILPEGRKLGGAPANFVYHVNSLGGHAELVSRVGGDALGDEASSLLKSRGVSVAHVGRDTVHPTGTVLATLDADGKASYVFPPDVAWDFLTLGRKTRELATNIRAVCFGSLAQRSTTSRTTILEFLDLLPASALKVFDINLRQNFYDRDTIEASLHRTDVFKISDEELPVVANMFGLMGSEKEVLAALTARFDLKLCALTRGPDGSLLLGRNDHHDHPGLPAQVADTIGAGDSFTAALTLGLLAGWSLEDINNRANEVAAAVCGQAGGMPELPSSLRICR